MPQVKKPDDLQLFANHPVFQFEAQFFPASLHHIMLNAFCSSKPFRELSAACVPFSFQGVPFLRVRVES
mgnify:CR=1 FL=1